MSMSHNSASIWRKRDLLNRKQYIFTHGEVFPSSEQANKPQIFVGKNKKHFVTTESLASHNFLFTFCYNSNIYR